MPPRIANILRRPWRALVALTLLVVAPKCVLCLAAYIGLGAALGLGGPEFCGTEPLASRTTLGIATALSALVGLTCLLMRKRVARRAPATVSAH